MITRSRSRFSPSLSFVLLCGFLLVLWLAGGASRADALGQPVVRVAAGVVLTLSIVFGPRPKFGEAKLLWLLLGACAALPMLQLLPLPPQIWLSLPGREVLEPAGALSMAGQPWRSLSIVPGATLNALGSLLIPLATLVLATSVRREERQSVPGLVLLLVLASTLLALLQISGAQMNNPLLNDTPGAISSSFANRNHFALFLVFGCMLAPVWAFSGDRKAGWRLPAAVGMVLIFVLTLLATGSRIGMLLGGFALGASLLIVRNAVRRELRQRARWVLPTLLAATFGLIALFVLLSVAADRAASITRLVEVDVSADMRSRALPVVWNMVRTYFPAGSGLGGFDPLFRLHEPFHLLKFTYFNHAHNDFLEVTLDAGLAGLLLLVFALVLWARASIQAWRPRGTGRHAMAKLGSAMLFAIIVASIFDYPARTPMIMAMIVVAGLWLFSPSEGARRDALPRSGQHL